MKLEVVLRGVYGYVEYYTIPMGPLIYEIYRTSAGQEEAKFLSFKISLILLEI